MGFQAGSLQNAINNWKNICVSDFVLDIIRYGVKFKFDSVPTVLEGANPKFNAEEQAFVDSEVRSLLNSGYLARAVNKPVCVAPIRCVPKKGRKKYRLVTDLRHRNSFGCPPVFKTSTPLT